MFIGNIKYDAIITKINYKLSCVSFASHSRIFLGLMVFDETKRNETIGIRRNETKRNETIGIRRNEIIFDPRKKW